MDVYASQYLTTDNICSMMTLALMLCGSDTSSMSVSSTAFATVRQLVALVMDAAGDALLHDVNPLQHSDSQTRAQASTKSISPHEHLPKCAELLVFDLTLFLKGKTGEWIRGRYGDTHTSECQKLILLSIPFPSFKPFLILIVFI